MNNKSAAHRRTYYLCKEGFLHEGYLVNNGKPLKYVSLSEKAWPHIRDTWDFEIDRPHFKSESPRHDIRLLEVVQRLQNLKVYDNFLSENVLQSSSALANDPAYRDLINLQSDGALLLKDTEGRSYLYALEFEISHKTIDRYQKKISTYYRVGGIDGVIYVCGGQKIEDLIARVDETVRQTRETILYRGQETDVLRNTEIMCFNGEDGQVLKLY